MQAILSVWNVSTFSWVRGLVMRSMWLWTATPTWEETPLFGLCLSDIDALSTHIIKGKESSFRSRGTGNIASSSQRQNVDELADGWNSVKLTYEPSHEIMVLSVLRKLILHTRIRSHPVGLYVWFLVGPFVYFYTSCVRPAKALARLRECAGSPEPSLVAYVINTIISWAGSYRLVFDFWEWIFGDNF